MRSQLCVTVSGRTMAELRRRRDEVTDADLVELRVDTVSDPSAAAALAGRRSRVIFTCRPKWEGGQFAGSEEERLRLLREAQHLGAEYVDVEWRAAYHDVIQTRGGKGVVLSMHAFGGVPADLSAQAQAMRSTGAEIIKLAVMAHRLTDNLTLLRLAQTSDAPTVWIAMGEAGIPSRVLATRFASSWTYAGDGVAPGQLLPARMLHEFGFRRLGAGTSLYGVVGRPVMHSLSPAMHNAAFQALKLDAVYLPLAAAEFDDFVSFAEGMNVYGASITAPFKLDAFAHAAERDAVSARVQSVNTLRRTGGRWEACNTDVAGLLAPLVRARVPLRGIRATVLGAGGAARAAAAALLSAGATVTIAARNRQRAEHVAGLFGSAVAGWPPAAHSWDLLVNATSVGTSPAVDETPLPDGPFTGSFVYDLVYNPRQTRLLRDAERAGCRVIGGLEMLVAQAERQFEWWTGSKPPAHVMHDAALNALRTVGTRDEADVV